MSAPSLRIIDYRPELAHYFKSINEEWISEMFTLESKDKRVLNEPEQEILATGGQILFAELKEIGIVGAVALLKTGPDEYELTKMGVSKSARGFSAGSALLLAAIERARNIEAKNLYLLTHSKCEAAIHLYEKHGFKHDPETMKRFGAQYARCDVAMRFYI